MARDPITLSTERLRLTAWRIQPSRRFATKPHGVCWRLAGSAQMATACARSTAHTGLRMSELTYRQAINQALDAELAADPEVFLLGEDIGAGAAYLR